MPRIKLGRSKENLGKRLKLNNRISQGFSASAGAAALLALSAYKGYHSRGLDPSASDIFKVCGGVGILLGAIWALTPAAKKSPSATIQEMKDNIYPVVTVMVKRAAEESMAEESPPAATNTEEDTPETPSYKKAYRSTRVDTGMDDDFEEEYRL